MHEINPSPLRAFAPPQVKMHQKRQAVINCPVLFCHITSKQGPILVAAASGERGLDAFEGCQGELVESFAW